MPKLSETALSDKLLKALKPKDHRYDVFDAVMRGMGVRVSTAGTKTWFVMRRVNGRMKRHSLGRYPTMSLAAARLVADGVLSDMAEGTVPEKDCAQSFESAFEEWLKRDQVNNRSVNDVEGAIRLHVLPTLRDIPLDSITKADIHRVVDHVVDAGFPVQANRVLSYLRRMFNWCVERGILNSTPVAGIKPPSKERSRDRVLSFKELLALWGAADSMGYPFGPMFQMLILTAQRREEVAGARWSEFDLGAATWLLPANRAKNGQAHLIHLTSTGLEILADIPRLEGAEHVFTTTGKGPIKGFSKAKVRIDKMSDVTDWTIHDIRRSFATHVTERLDINPAVVDKILNHVSGAVKGVAAVYQRGEYLAQREAAMCAWENLLLRPEDANVIHRTDPHV